MSHCLLKEARDRLEVLRGRLLDGEAGKADDETQDLVWRIDNHLKTTISVIWDISDVQEIRPGLGDAQALEVLQHFKRNHDATQGVTWETLQFHAEQLLGEAPDTRPPYTSLTMRQAYLWLMENDVGGATIWDLLVDKRDHQALLDNVGQNLRDYGDEGCDFCYVDAGLGLRFMREAEA